MTHAAYVAAGYLIVFITLAVYAAVTLVRERRLSRKLSPEVHPWT